MAISRQVFIISDLHLGGAPPDPASNDDEKKRGFRMMKHPDKLADFIKLLAARTAPAAELVINGDFIDFLAEETAPGTWSSFRSAPGAALATLKKIVARDEASGDDPVARDEASGDEAGGDGPVFKALRAFVSSGHKLTVLVGNHDLELALPDLRDWLDEYLGGRVHWLMDSEALVVGDAVIEHGNAYDPANAVDHAALRRVRALRSRRRDDDGGFRPPVGSEFVVKVMNPFKKRYGFVDLLKPESEALFALILAIAPEMKDELGKLLAFVPPLADQLRPVPGMPAALKNVNAVVGTAPPPAPAPEADPLRAFLQPALSATALDELAGPAATSTSAAVVAAGATLANVSAKTWLWAKLGMFRALVDDSKPLSDARLEALRWAFRGLDEDKTWEEGTETGKRYLKAAEKLMEPTKFGPGFKYVVFGHTHHAKRIKPKTKPGCVYLNSGTWANVMRFPALDADRTKAMQQLRAFVESAETNKAVGELKPTYVRLDVNDAGKVEQAALCRYDYKAKRID